MRRWSLLSAWFAVGAIGMCAVPAVAAETSMAYLVPLPAHVETLPGRFVPGAQVRVALSDPKNAELAALGELAAELLRESWDRPIDIARQPASEAHPADVVLKLGNDKANPESYRLDVSAPGIELSAPSPAGLFYGLQTLRQLAPPGSAKDGISALHISDAPRFAYRGLHLDVGRHLYPLAFIKKYVDLMARYKFNTFHWHLTEDQGWRLEIKRFPKLTSIGGYRKETQLDTHHEPYVGDGKPYGGFYTQEEIRELVAYAARRHVTVIPEIDLPGHTKSALAAYPELACTPGPFEVRTRWGVDDEVMCPSEATFRFIEGVLAEVIDLFPSKYIHVGGDEAPTTRWKESALAQDLMKREGMKGEVEIQRYFLRRIEAFLARHDRKLIGWDEILAGGLSPNATVMAWRGTDYARQAAEQGHDAIQSPTSHAYFDYCPGDYRNEPICRNSARLALDQVYRFEPVPEGLPIDKAHHILGGQANVWTEYLKTPEEVEYMLWPRALAMAEVLWSPREQRDWASFQRRLEPQLHALDRLHVNYRVPDVLGLEEEVVSLETTAPLKLQSPIAAATIHYTLDGSEPGPQSPRYQAPIDIALTEQGTTVKARLLFANGRWGPNREARFRRETIRPAPPYAGESLTPGLKRRYIEIDDWAVHTSKLRAKTPARSDVAAQVGIPEFARPEWFGLLFDGLLLVPEDGLYRFALISDDGAVLEFDDKSVIDRDGPNSPSETVAYTGLAAGYHPVSVRYFQGGGGSELKLLVSRNGGLPGPVPENWFFHRP